MWDNCATAQHYETKEWPTWDSYTPGVKNIQHIPSVNLDKSFDATIAYQARISEELSERNGKTVLNGFEFLCKKFTKLSQAKLKEGIFVGPQILEVFEDPEFGKALNALELRAWHAFKWICSNFF